MINIPIFIFIYISSFVWYNSLHHILCFSIYYCFISFYFPASPFGYVPSSSPFLLTFPPLFICSFLVFAFLFLMCNMFLFPMFSFYCKCIIHVVLFPLHCTDCSVRCTPPPLEGIMGSVCGPVHVPLELRAPAVSGMVQIPTGRKLCSPPLGGPFPPTPQDHCMIRLPMLVMRWCVMLPCPPGLPPVSLTIPLGLLIALHKAQLCGSTARETVPCWGSSFNSLSVAHPS